MGVLPKRRVDPRIDTGRSRPCAPGPTGRVPLRAGDPRAELDDENVTVAHTLGTWTYPSATVFDDRVFLAYRYTRYREHPEYAQLVGSSENQGAYGSILKLKVFPLSWFYGSKKPADPLDRYPFTSVQI